MTQASPIAVDVLIFGGGVAGLWLLDDLRRAGYRALLLESEALGAGQTVASQGIIHGGLKYTLSGLLTPSADAIREMPQVWRDCLAGRRAPDLRRTTVRAEFCHLWRTGDLRSMFGMIGARAGLRVAPIKLDRSGWPAALANCPGDVFQLNEQVIDPAALLADLAAQHAEALLRIDESSVTVERAVRGADSPAVIIRVGSGRSTADEPELTLHAETVVLAAGSGNGELRRRFGLADEAMQLRPLHMVMLRGDLPSLNGHCTDGAKTRVTITSATDAVGRIVWQVGGQIAEDGVGLDRAALLAHARRELSITLPGVSLDGAEWATYRVDRAESAAGGRRPEGAAALRDGRIITAWPTKLALAPRLAETVRAMLPPPRVRAATVEPPELATWPRPAVASPPWEMETEWTTAS